HGDDTVRTATTLAAATLVAVGALLGWLSATGRLAADNKKDSTPADPPRNVLPIPEQPFRGVVGRTVKDSTPDFPRQGEAPRAARNVLLILPEDVGFGATSTFGGPIPPPTFDRLAANGLRYNNFHTTGLCSPTRAALITGRNHHTCSTGVITEFATGYDGYTS